MAFGCYCNTDGHSKSTRLCHDSSSNMHSAGRLANKERKRTITEELLADPDLSQARKRRFDKLQVWQQLVEATVCARRALQQQPCPFLFVLDDLLLCRLGMMRGYCCVRWYSSVHL